MAPIASMEELEEELERIERERDELYEEWKNLQRSPRKDAEQGQEIAEELDRLEERRQEVLDELAIQRRKEREDLEVESMEERGRSKSRRVARSLDEDHPSGYYRPDTGGFASKEEMERWDKQVDPKRAREYRERQKKGLPPSEPPEEVSEEEERRMYDRFAGEREAGERPSSDKRERQPALPPPGESTADERDRRRRGEPEPSSSGWSWFDRRADRFDRRGMENMADFFRAVDYATGSHGYRLKEKYFKEGDINDALVAGGTILFFVALYTLAGFFTSQMQYLWSVVAVYVILLLIAALFEHHRSGGEEE